MRFVKLELEISRQVFWFFILGLVCLVKTAFQLFAELVFCETTKIFPPEKGSAGVW
jgi:hypothetical protein